MRAVLLHLAFVQHKNVVGILNGGNAVRYDDGRATLAQAVQIIQYLPFCVRINSRERIVQQQNRRILHQRACNGGTLLLTAGNRHAAFAHQRLVLLGELHDVIVDAGVFRRLLHRFQRLVV